MWWLSFKNLQACGYHVPPSVETGCSPYLFTRFNTKRSATDMYLSFDILIWRISWLSFSKAIHNQTYWELPLMIVSSIINSVIRIYLSGTKHLWFVFLNHVFDDGSMTSFYKPRHSFGSISRWKTQEIKKDTDNMLYPRVLLFFLFDTA